MRVRDSVRVPADVSAAIVPISLISDRYVQLAPVWRSGPVLRDGAQIPLDHGMAPAELDDLLATLKRFLQALEPGTAKEPGALGAFVQNTDKALAGQGPALGRTIDSLSTLLDVLGRNVDSVDATIVNLDKLFAELSKHDAALEATNRGLATVMGALSQEQTALAEGPGHLANLVNQLGSLVRAHKTDLADDLQVLANATDAIARQKDGLLTNILWLPVLSQGVAGAFDKPNKRVFVRDWPALLLKP
jgi:phospholipid/cholesterol/gamma-HCH transport system substrate-binding protein